MAHPCAGHACDHCLVCDVEGRCCASPISAAPASPPTDQRLVAAAWAEAAARRGIADLVRLEHLTCIGRGTDDRQVAAQAPAVASALAQKQQRALPEAVPNTAPPIYESRKEQRHV